MSVYNQPRQAVAQDAKKWIRANRYDLEDLPEPSEAWKAKDTGFDSAMILNLRHKNLLQRLERDQRTGSTYRTKKEAYEVLQEALDSPDGGFLPCKASDCPANAFRTTSEGIECKRCGTVHDRSEVEI